MSSMSSILTNSGALVALQSLEATNTALNNTQNQISTGLAIQSAKDNAAVWTVATTMQANVASLNQVSSDLGNADSILGTAVSGAGQITSLVSQIRAQVASFTDTSTNQTATSNNVSQLANQIQATVESSSFNGVDLLDSSQPNGLTFLAATNNSYAGQSAATMATASPTISTGATTDLSQTSTAATVSDFNALVQNLSTIIGTTELTGATALTVNGTATTLGAAMGASTLPTYAAGATTTQIQQANQNFALSVIDNFSQTVESAASTLGSTQANVESQQTFVQNLSSSFQTGAGNMVDANMTAESAQLSALQTQQQLGTQALSIANQAPQMILKLFNG